jgi:EpsI family protein
MIISHRHKFIFIKNRKVGSTSTEVALQKICGPDDILTPDSMWGCESDVLFPKARNYRGWYLPFREIAQTLTPLDTARALRDLARRPKFYNHIRASLVRARIDRDIWDSYYKFCFERNPWDKTVSFYYWFGRDQNLPPFTEYILNHRKYGTDDQTLPSDWTRYTLDDRLIVDDVFDYRDLSGGLRTALRRAGAWGLFWLIVATDRGGLVLRRRARRASDGLGLPEYSHGPLIPILSGLLFLRQLKEYPPEPGPKRDRWVGVMVILAAFAMGTAGQAGQHLRHRRLCHDPVGGRHPSGQFRLEDGQAFLATGPASGLHAAPARRALFQAQHLAAADLVGTGRVLPAAGQCAGLPGRQHHRSGRPAPARGRGLFGPALPVPDHVLLLHLRRPLSRADVAQGGAADLGRPDHGLHEFRAHRVAGIIAQRYGTDWLDGFTHFFEGWVIFITCVAILFLLAWVLLKLQRKMTLPQALDLETDGLTTQAARIRLVQPSAALITSAVLALAAIGAFQALPERGVQDVARDPFYLFPRNLGDWQQDGPREILAANIVDGLNSPTTTIPSSWRARRMNRRSGFSWRGTPTRLRAAFTHPRSACPGAGWEIAWLERSDIADRMGTDTPFNINRAIIQQNDSRMMVYYWFQQGERRIAWDFAAKFYLLIDGVTSGSTDGALIRLTTLIGPDEEDAVAEARLQSVLDGLMPILPRFVPDS